MNFAHMPELNKPWAYPVIIGLVVMIVATIYITLRRNRWL
jgi:magnesium transporter